MRKTFVILTLVTLAWTCFPSPTYAQEIIPFKLGNEVLYTRYHHLIQGKRVGLITNQSGVNSQGQSTIDILSKDESLTLTALYGPEHGIDGEAGAGAWVESYTHPSLGIPVYSLYGATRTPTKAMLENIDVLLYDVQDIGSRTYTYISTLQYAMKAAKNYGKRVVVLDRPNPVGCEIVEGPVLEDELETFVGVDNLPMAHGMTAGELARFFNREIGCELTVVPMEGYTRDMIYQDTGLPWVKTSPNIPDIDSVFGYMATGLGQGTGIRQMDQFKWLGGPGVNSDRFAQLLNSADLPGVSFIPEPQGSMGGVRLNITDYKTFNPAKTGHYALAYAKILSDFAVPKSTTNDPPMFDKIMGTYRIGRWLEQKLDPCDMELLWADELAAFRTEREEYLIYGYAGGPNRVGVFLDGVAVFFDSPPYIDENDRTMVPIRAIAEGLGAEVIWTANDEPILIVKPGQEVSLTLGQKTARVNGEIREMDTVPLLVKNRTMVPLRFVSEFLGAEVLWDELTRTAIVNQAH